MTLQPPLGRWRRRVVRCRNVLGLAFLVHLYFKLLFIVILLPFVLASELWNIYDPIPDHSFKNSIFFYGEFSWDVLRYPFGALRVFTREETDAELNAQLLVNTSRAVGQIEILSEYTLPYDAKFPVMSLTDDLLTNQLLKSKYEGPKTFLAGWDRADALQRVESDIAKAHLLRKEYVVLLGHNERGVYKWRLGTKVEEIDHAVVDALAAKYGVRVVHLSCDSQCFSPLGVEGVQRSYVLAERVVEAGKALSPTEQAMKLGLRDESAIAKGLGRGGGLRKGLKRFHPLKWLGGVANLYDLFERSRQMHEMEKQIDGLRSLSVPTLELGTTRPRLYPGLMEERAETTKAAAPARAH